MKQRKGSAPVAQHLNILVTPIWAARLAPDERWNVATTIRSSGDVEHRFLAPDDLDTTYYSVEFPDSRIERFPRHHFRDIRAYSRFMLDPSLYERFIDHEFLTVVQTDAVLIAEVSDVLQDAEFDYAGAPWQTPFQVSLPALLDERLLWRLQSRFLLARRLDVGNGGLSVRRTARVLEVLRRFGPLPRLVRLNEDLVLAYLGGLGLLRVAARREAARLFYELDASVPPEEADVRGFHALDRYHPEFQKVLQARMPSAPSA